MAVFAISMVRDEADIIGYTAGHMLSQVDDMIVADNGSSDGTADILRDLGVKVLDDPVRGYYQSSKMTALAHYAQAAGAEWVVPFDADEIWYSPWGRISDVLRDLGSQWLVAEAELYDHVATAVDPSESNPVRRIGWRRRTPGALPKVACRTRDDLVIAQGNHSAHYDGGPTVIGGQLIVRHFPYRSPEQFQRKARNGAEAYRMTDLPEDVGAHWRRYGDILEQRGPEALDDVFYEWFYSHEPETDDALIYDPAPATWTSRF